MYNKIKNVIQLKPYLSNGSRPVLGGADGEIPSVYSTLDIRVFFNS